MTIKSITARYNNIDDTSRSIKSLFFAILEIEYLVVAGGGGGGLAQGISQRSAGGGGAGGFLLGYISLDTFNTYSVVVGAGGPGNVGSGQLGTDDPNQRKGSDSIMSSLTSIGGGGGGGGGAGAGGVGGSGGGHGRNRTVDPAAGTLGQGNSGGVGAAELLATSGGGGGGGASSVGADGTSLVGGDGGDGIESTITGSLITYAGGGGGGRKAGNGGTGGVGGGGTGASGNANGTSGSVNSGGGGGGASIGDIVGVFNGGNGGSGVIILRYPKLFFPIFSSGVSASTIVDNDEKVTEITATSTTSETIKFVSDPSGLATSNPDIISVTIPGTCNVGTPIVPSISYFGSPEPTFSYQWERRPYVGAEYSEIVGATSLSYTPIPDDAGSLIRVVVTASNIYGTSSKASADSVERTTVGF